MIYVYIYIYIYISYVQLLVDWLDSIDSYPNVQYTYVASTTPGRVFNFFSALGDVAFAYAGHNVVLEIQAFQEPNVERSGFCLYCGCPLLLPSCFDWVLDVWLIAAANMFVVIHIIGSYQVN